MTDGYEKALDEFIGTMGRITTAFGLPALGGRIYGMLAFVPRPISLGEIADTLHVAKSGVSVNVRLLENLGIVRRVWVKGDRRDYYEVDFDLIHLYHGFFKKGIEAELEPTFATIEKCLTLLDDDVDPENREEAEIIKKRLERHMEMKDPLLTLFRHLVTALAELKELGEGE
ncbi:MAG: MarR family transcriptional regulator [Candidatus Zixiibacteriota bacterium]